MGGGFVYWNDSHEKHTFLTSVRGANCISVFMRVSEILGFTRSLEKTAYGLVPTLVRS
jgi:hypothetical protein